MALGIILLVWLISIPTTVIALWLGFGGHAIAFLWVGTVIASLLLTYIKALCQLRKERDTEVRIASNSQVPTQQHGRLSVRVSCTLS